MNFIIFLKKYKWFLFIFLLALVCRLAYFGLSFESRGGDLMATISGADCYYALSENILHGNIYSCDTEPPYTLNAVRPPVYPYFLAFTYTLFGSYWGVLLVQILIGSLLPLIGMALASYLFKDVRIVRAVGVVLAIEPFSILFSIFFYSETVFMFFFLLSLLFLFRYFSLHRLGDVGVSAALLGASVLTKPTIQYFYLIVLAALFVEARKRLTHKTWIAAGTFLAIFLLAVTPWLWRNYQAFGSFSISPQKEVNIYSIMVPSVLAVANNTNFQVEFKKILEAGALDPNSATFEGTEDYVAMAIPVFLAHPVSFVIVCANTTLNFFIHDGMYDVLKHVGYRPDQFFGKPALFVLLTDPAKFISFVGHFLMTPIVLILVGRILWIIITILFVIGVIKYLLRSPKVYGTLAIIAVLYFLLTTLVVGLGVNARYRLPVNAFVVAFAASEALVVATFIRKKILPPRV